MDVFSSIRNARFKVCPGEKIDLVLESRLGTNHLMQVNDCSITGLLAIAQGGSASAIYDELNDDTIIPSSKLVVGENEIFLGRLAIQRKTKNDDKVQIAFSTVDSRIPVDGVLSRYLDRNFRSGKASFEVELPPTAFNLASFVVPDLMNVDIFDRARKFSVFYEEWKDTDRFAYFFERKGRPGARVDLKKHHSQGRCDFLMFGSNDYLGLASHPEMIASAIQAIEAYGVGSTGTAITSGTTDAHMDLADDIARFYGKEDALVYPSGYNANVGIISGLAREQDLLIADIISHASIQDGMTMSRATARFFKHNDMDHLEKILKENRNKHGGCMILTEGIFSMDGTVGKLGEIVQLADQYKARIFVDQGHCVGILGDRGLGTCEFTNTTRQIDLIMGLFSKAIGTMGGFVAGPRDVMNWLRSYSRSFMFATSFPPAVAVATRKAFELIHKNKDLRFNLDRNIKHFSRSLNRIGPIVPNDHISPIFPVVIGDENKMGAIMRHLISDGIFALPVCYPVVAKNRCRFRFSITANHTITDLDYAASSLQRAAEKTGVDLAEVAKNLGIGVKRVA